MRYVLDRADQNEALAGIPNNVLESPSLQTGYTPPLTEILEGDLYFCLEERKVCVSGQEIELTAKEFDALRLLIMNRKRVLTFEMISYQVWGEEYIDITVKTIHNLMGRLRQKLKVMPDSFKYIRSIRGVGYKFDISQNR